MPDCDGGQYGRRHLQAVLPGRDGVRSSLQSLDDDRGAGAGLRIYPVQRSEARCAQDVAALLSKRLKDLEVAGVIQRVPIGAKPGSYEYHLTEAGRELEPIVKAMGFWGQRWVETAPTLQNVDPELLMWDMRRSIKVAALPRRRTVVQFTYSDRPEKKRRYWLIVEANGAVDVCSIDPGFEIDLYVTTDIRTMTAIWLGLTTIRAETERDRLTAVGDRRLEQQMPVWLGLSAFATERKRAG